VQLARGGCADIRSKNSFPLRTSTSPAAITKEYRVVGDGVGSSCHILTDDGWIINTDIPKLQGGTHTAPQPVLLLLASLAGCELATARFVAFKSLPRIKMGKIVFDLQARRDERGAIHLPLTARPLPAPARLERVWGTAVVHGTDATPEQIVRLGEEVHLRCPVANMMVLSGCALEIEWKVAAASPP
jgi:uncharacterized OsmC-like protein